MPAAIQPTERDGVDLSVRVEGASLAACARAMLDARS